MSFWNLFKKKYFYINLIAGIVILFIIGYIVMFWLKGYTRQDEIYELPDFIGMPMDSLIDYSEKFEMRYVIMDSVFDDSKPKGSIVLQNPLPHAHIKTGRTIYVSIVSQTPEMSVVPNLINLSVRQGVNLLKNCNLDIDEIQFVEGFDRNSIQSVLFNNESIDEGSKILKNSKLSLVVSKGSREQYELIPNVFGMTEQAAYDILHENSFNVGNVKRDQVISDAQYYVYYQYPAKNTANPLGCSVNLKLTVNKNEIKELYEESLYLNDSLEFDYIDSVGKQNIFEQ